MLGGLVGEAPDIVSLVRGWAFDLHLLGFSVDPRRVRAAERTAVAATRMGASMEDALEFARVALEGEPVPEVVHI